MVRGRSSNKSITELLLEALLPYTDANLNVLFNRREFYKQLENTGGYKVQSYRNAFRRLQQRGLIELEGNLPYLTERGYAELQLYRPQILKNARIIVIFDIPEAERDKRAKLRILLRQLKFRQEQKSVWSTEYECRSYLKAEIKQLKLQDYIKIFEAIRLEL